MTCHICLLIISYLISFTWNRIVIKFCNLRAWYLNSIGVPINDQRTGTILLLLDLQCQYHHSEGFTPGEGMTQYNTICLRKWISVNLVHTSDLKANKLLQIRDEKSSGCVFTILVEKYGKYGINLEFVVCVITDMAQESCWVHGWLQGSARESVQEDRGTSPTWFDFHLSALF